MLSSKEVIEKTEKYSAHNYHPKEVVIVKGEGAQVIDPEGKKYFDMLSAYSALNFGHCNKEIVEDTKLFLKMSIDTNKKLDIMPDLLKGKQMALRITLDFINDNKNELMLNEKALIKINAIPKR